MSSKPLDLTPTLINKWRLFVEHVGQLWMGSKLTGYAETGPYHCGDCRHLVGKLEGDVYRDPAGEGRCDHQLVKLDPEVKRDEYGAIVNIEKGCCDFVNDDLRGIKQQ